MIIEHEFKPKPFEKFSDTSKLEISKDTIRTSLNFGQLVIGPKDFSQGDDDFFGLQEINDEAFSNKGRADNEE